MKEALFYQKLDKDKVKCQLCSHYCLIAEGQFGICGVRQNQKGTLYSLVYGVIAANQIDPIEKKPLFHFLPGTTTYSLATVGCNFRCLFCQNYHISQIDKSEPEIFGTQAKPQEIVFSAMQSGCQSISYTYSEPTIFYEFAKDTSVIAHEKGLKNIFVTNGFMSTEALEDIAPYLDAANVDLKSFSEDFYKKVCGARLSPVLDNLKRMVELGIWLEITTLIIPGLNDSPEELTSIARFIREKLGRGVPWHVTAFHPTYKMLDRPKTPPEKINEAIAIGLKEGLKYVHGGNI